MEHVSEFLTTVLKSITWDYALSASIRITGYNRDNASTSKHAKLSSSSTQEVSASM
jgi:hypothetical protein